MENLEMSEQTIRRLIVSDEELMGLWDRSKTITDKIRVTQDLKKEKDADLYAFKTNGINSIKENISRIESETAFMIASDVGDDGKPKYKNEAQRTGAYNDLLSKNSDYQEYQQALKAAERKQYELEQAIESVKYDLQYLLNDYSMIKHQLDVVAGLSREGNQITINLKA